MKAMYFRNVPDDIHDYVVQTANSTGRSMADVVTILLTKCRADGVFVPRKMPGVRDESPTADQLPRRRS